jgi:hypothetical protein
VLCCTVVVVVDDYVASFHSLSLVDVPCIPSICLTATVHIQPGMQAEEVNANRAALDERRAREKRQTHVMTGMLCGGCFVCLCMGTDKAADCGVKVADTLLCSNVYCFGF